MAPRDLTNHIRQAVTQLKPTTTSLLQQLVRIPSISGEEAAAQRHVADHLRAMGLDVDVWCPTRAELEDHSAFSDDGRPLGARPVVVGRWGGTDATARSLILNGHVDAVPVGDEASWTHGPWSGAVHDGQLWGRGSCDMKGGLVAGITAIAALQKIGLQPRGDLLIESVIGEETGGVGTLATLVRGYRADAAIVLEPTRLAMCPVGSGALSFRLRVPGRAAHGALRLEGVSAVKKFCSLFAALRALERARHAAFSHSLFGPDELAAPLSVGRVRAGDWPSTVPDSLVAEGRYGVFPGETLDAARAQFESAVSVAADTDPWLREHRPTVEWFEGQFEPAETPSDAPILATLTEAHANLIGAPPRIHGVPYGSDLRLFTNHGPIHAVLYGPGDVALAHTVDEHVPLGEVMRAAEVIALTIVRWCQAD